MKNKIFKMVLSAVFCAMVFTMTWISIPAPSVGNINLGDCMIILCAYLLGGPYSIFAGAIGASLCDLASGYVIYAPGTFFIKALMVIAVLLMRKYVLKNDKLISLIVFAACAEIIMIVGYLFYESLILGYGLAAIMNIPFNAIQGVANIVAFAFLFALLKKSGFTQMITNDKNK